MASLRITIPLAAFNLSGGVKSLVALANALAARGHRVRILAPDFAPTPPAPLDPAVRVRVLRSGPAWLPMAARKLIHLLSLSTTATAGADLCLANYFTTAYAAWLSRTARRDRTRLAYNVRAYEPLSHGLLARAGLPSRLVRFGLAWLSYRLPLAKICTTEWLRDQIGDPRAYVVGHGIDLELLRPGGRPEHRTRAVVGAIGRLGDVKGYPDLLAALAMLDSGLPIRLRLATPDAVPLPERFAVETVHATEPSQMAEFYRGCDVFVFSSRAEGFGLPALEAMACGCAVVTTDCGGIRAFARPDENCLMVPPADPSELALAIERLVGDYDLRSRLVAGGLTTAGQFSQDTVLERFCDHLERLAGERGRAVTRPGSCDRSS